MPATAEPISREAIKTLAIAVGVREAARQVGLPESTVKSWSTRDKWFKAPELPPTMTRPNDASIASKQPSEALAALVNDGTETRLSLSRSVLRGAKALEAMPDEVKFTAADRVKHLVGAASTLHGWEEKKQDQAGLVSIALIRLELPAAGEIVEGQFKQLP